MIGNVVAARPHGFGSWSQIAASGPSIAASAGTPAAVAAAGGMSTAAGAALSVAIPVAGVVIGALIGSLFAAHAKRVAGAKQENQVLSSLIPTVIQAISAVYDNANSGQISAEDAVAGLEQIRDQYWQAVSQVESGPGQAGGPSKCQSLSDTANPVTTCDRSCTASCCIGCDVVEKWIYRSIRWFQTGSDIVGQKKGSGGAGGGPGGWDGVVGNKYGLANFNPPNWQYTPPPPGSIVAGGSAGILSGSVLGIPIWMILAGLVAWKALA